GEVIPPPPPPLRVDLVRLRQRNQVADGPGDDVAVAAEEPVALLGRPEDASDVPGDGGLFSEDGDGGRGHLRDGPAIWRVVPILRQIAPQGEKKGAPAAGSPIETGGRGGYSIRAFEDQRTSQKQRVLSTKCARGSGS